MGNGSNQECQHCRLTTGVATLQLFGLNFEVALSRPLIIEIKMEKAVGTAQSPNVKCSVLATWE